MVELGREATQSFLSSESSIMSPVLLDTKLQALGFALLEFVLSLSLLSMLPFRSLATRMFILCHFMLETCNLFLFYRSSEKMRLEAFKQD